MARFTALVWDAANGSIGPTCAAAGPDLRSTRILDTLMRCPGFTVGDGWEQKTWERSMPLMARGKAAIVLPPACRRQHDHHSMGSARGMAMRADVQLGPWAARTSTSRSRRA